jgi:hypothetical protein
LSRLKILLDECLDRRLGRELPEHDVRTVPQMGWPGIKNGQLLSRAQGEFDVFITVDRNLAFQQNLPNFSIAVLVLHAPTNRLQDHLPLIPAIRASLRDLKAGVATPISS